MQFQNGPHPFAPGYLNVILDSGAKFNEGILNTCSKLLGIISVDGTKITTEFPNKQHHGCSTVLKSETRHPPVVTVEASEEARQLYTQSNCNPLRNKHK